MNMVPFSGPRRSVLAWLVTAAIASLPLAGASAQQRVTLPPGTTLPQATTAPDATPPIAGRVDPATYLVGPGDEFALRYSDLLEPRILRVGPAGDLVLPDVGRLSVAGLTLKEMETRVRERMRPFVRGQGFDISLYRPRRFRLYVTGEVVNPGTVTLQAPVRASEAIEAAGGVSGTGARRGIQIRRGADTLLVDLFLASRGGALDADPLVFESDVLYVPPQGRRVEIFGAVTHPGRYDFVPGDRWSTLVAAAGGILPGAVLTDATVERFDATGASERSTARLDEALAAPGSAADATLREGDRLFIPGRARWMEGDMVFVEGEVTRPGPYPIRADGDRVRSVLELAGGFTPLADSAATRVEHVMSGTPADSAFLRLAQANPDILTPSDREYLVTRSRERRAISANVGRSLSRGDPLGNVPLHDGDRIVVPRRVPLVAVQGEVKAPGFVPYVPGRRLGDYVNDAGGFTSRARESHIRVTIAATGGQVQADEVRSLEPGDAIWVPAKPDRNTWGGIRDVITVAAQLATIYLVIREATRP
jgi:protein involved in polysaccharide export with SLBB domain